MQKILTIALLLGSLTVNAQTKPVQRVLIPCKQGNYLNVYVTAQQKDSLLHAIKTGYKGQELVTLKGKQYIALYKQSK